MKIFISNNPANLAEALAQFKNTATVEAEYGDTVVKGSILTLAHHGPRSGNPCPCVTPVIRVIDNPVEVIGISHFDLDTLGGIMRIIAAENGRSDPDGSAEFWGAAAFVDLNGPHRLGEFRHAWCRHNVPESVSDLVRRELNAFWAWSEQHRLFPPRDGSVVDATEFFEEAIRVIGHIFRGDGQMEPVAGALLTTGEEWAEGLAHINAMSILRNVTTESGIRVCIRKSNQFVNAMYQIGKSGKIADAVVGYNTRTKAITLSFERPGIGNACDVMQAAFGLEAGGHAGIAGSPRGVALTLEDTEKVLALL